MIPFNPFSELTSKIYGAVAIAAITFGAVQTIRIEGLKVWPIHIMGYREENDRLSADLKEIIKGQKTAMKKQDAQDKAILKDQLSHNQELEKFNDQLEIARTSAVANYIATHRVRKEALGGPRCGPEQARVHSDPGQPDTGRTDSGDLIALRPEDIEAESRVEVQNTSRGKFLRGLIDQGLAIPQSQLPDPAYGGKP